MFLYIGLYKLNESVSLLEHAFVDLGRGSRRVYVGAIFLRNVSAARGSLFCRLEAALRRVSARKRFVIVHGVDLESHGYFRRGTSVLRPGLPLSIWLQRR